jgi:hypothetical protein
MTEITEFKSIIYRQGMAPEVAKAAVYAKDHPEVETYAVGKTNVIPDSVLGKIKPGAILVLGTYYDVPSIAALSKKGPVTVFFYGVDDLAKYGPVLAFPALEMFTPDEIAKHPWLSRTISRFEGRATPDDEAFQRGVIQQRTLSEILSGDMLPVFARMAAGEYDERDMIAQGLATAKTYEQMAISIDATAATDVLVFGKKARFAVTGSEPVMPIVEQLAKGEGKLGITMRYSFKNGVPVTMITVFTSDPASVNIDFVASHWGGGGTEKCKGKTFAGFWVPVLAETGTGPPEFSVQSFPGVKVD